MLLIPCDLIKVTVLCKHRFPPSNHGTVLWFLYHMYLFFSLSHCKMLLFLPGRFEEEFSTANKICFSSSCMECYFGLQRERVTGSGTNGQIVECKIKFLPLQYSLGTAQKLPSNKCYKLLGGRGVVFHLDPSLIRGSTFQTNVTDNRVMKSCFKSRLKIFEFGQERLSPEKCCRKAEISG